MLAHAADAQIFLDRSRIVLNRISEEKSSLFDEILEPFRARLQQLEHGEKPGVPIADDTSSFHSPAASKQRLQTRGRVRPAPAA